MKLKASYRNILWKKVKQLRKEGLIPAIVYGKHMDKPLDIVCKKNDVLKIYKKYWVSQPFSLVLEDWKEEMVLLHDYQVHPVTDFLLHVDFLVLTKWEKTHADIEIEFIWESKVEKEKTWKLQILRRSLEVEALPKDLPKSLVVDLSVIKTKKDVIFVKDIKVPKWVRILVEEDVPLVTVDSLGWSSEWEEVETWEEVSTENNPENKEE